MVCKDEVVDWFHKLNGAGRLDVMCTLLDECLPFELRFLGTVMENLGRRDFHELRHVDHRANTFLHPSRAGVTDKMALCSALMDATHQQQLSSPSNANVHPLPFTGPPAAFNSAALNQTIPENSIPTSRPNSVQHIDKVRSSCNSGGSPQSQQPNMVLEGQFLGGRHQGDGSNDSGSKATSLNLPVNNSNENSDDKSDKSILVDDIVRRRLILYLSLLTATNRECANVYYKILSEVQPLIETTGWLESVEGHMLEEMSLLYTIASNHPAFTFKQRSAMSDVCIKFCNQQSKLETPKVFTQATQSFIATAVHGFDPKFGQYYIHYVPHPVQAMQWQSPNGSGNLIGGTNGTVEEGNRLQSPVTFTMPPYHAFPAMYMPTHLPRSQAPPIHHTQVQVPHQFSQNLPVQSTVSPQAAQLGIASQPLHPTQIVPHSFQQSPQVQGSAASHNQIHIQSQPHVPHAYSSSMNGPVQNILPVPSGIHAQLQPVGLSNVPTIASTVPQYQPKTQNVSQLSPQLPTQVPPRNSLLVGATNNLTSAAFPSQSNSLDGNESEECCWDSTESSPFQSPPQSLTPSRSQSPTPMNNQAHVITNQNPSYVNVQPVVSHLSVSQEMNSHSNSAAVIAPSTAFCSPSQRSVCSSATSISPPPRSQKTSSSQKHSQNIQVQARILPKNAQDIEVSMAGLNNVNVPYSSVPVSTPSVSMAKSSNCIVSANNMNGFKPSLSDRRSMSNSKVSVTNLMNNCNLNSSPNVSTSLAVTQTQGVMQPIVAVVSSSANYTLSAPHLIPASSSSIQQQQQQSQQPQPQREASRRHQSNRRAPTSNQPSHHTPNSVSSHYNLHSQPMKNTNVASSAHNLSQYSFSFPFSIPSYPPQPQQPAITPGKGSNTTSHQSTIPATKQQVSSQTVVTNNQNGGKVNVSNNDMPIIFSGHPQQSNSHNHNGIKLSAHDCASTFNVPTALSSNLTIINSTPTALQHPATSAPPPSQSSRNRVLLEVGGGQDVVGRIDGIQFLEELADDSSRSKTSCYNCGAQTHVGPDCKENTMEEMTKHPYRINFHPETSPQETKDTE